MEVCEFWGFVLALCLIAAPTWMAVNQMPIGKKKPFAGTNSKGQNKCSKTLKI